MDALTPRSLEEALHLRAEHPDALPIQGGTDVMVALNFDRERPRVLLNLNEVAELRGWSRDNGTLRLGAGLTYTEALHDPLLAGELPALAEASRTVGSPQIRNRGTIGGNLGTASPAGDALPPLLVEGAEVVLASTRGERRLPLEEFLVGPKRNALAEDELILAVEVRPSGQPQTFMKVGPRNAMVIAVCSLALVADRERGELRASYGSAGPVPGLVVAPLDEAGAFASRSPRRRARSTTSAAPPRTAATHSCAHQPGAREVSGVKTLATDCCKLALFAPAHGSGSAGLCNRLLQVITGASHEDRADDQRRAPRGGRLGGREPAHRAPRPAGAPRLEERVRAGRVRLLLGAPRRDARLLVPRPRGAGGRPRGRHGRGSRRDGDLHPVQSAFVDAGAVQCGFCTPGLVVAADDLLRRIPEPSDDEIREALSGNLCRCTGYQKILDAVRAAAAR